MLLLAFDTATPAVTVAVHDGARVRAARTEIDARRHGELLAPAVEAVLAEAGVTRGDLTHLAVGVGPGPFTGLRVGLVTARVLGAALQLPVLGVCTLDVLAAQHAGVARGPFVVATDARRREVYWARYDDAGRRLEGPRVDRPGDLIESGVLAGLPVVGQGAALYPELRGEAATAVPEPLLPDAAALATLAARAVAAGEPLLPPQPLYLRRPDAVPPGAPKPVSGRAG